MKPITSAFTAPAIPKTSSYTSVGVSSPSALASANRSVYTPPAAPKMSVYTPPKVAATPVKDPRIGANASYVNPADAKASYSAAANATAAKGTVPYIPAGPNGGGMSLVPNQTSVKTGKPTSGVPGAVTPSTVAPYKPPAPAGTPKQQAAESASRTTSSTPAAPSFSSFTSPSTPASTFATPAPAAPSYGGYDAASGAGQTPTYTPSPTNGYDAAGAGAPTLPGGLDLDKLLKSYEDTINPSDEEKQAKKRLSQLNDSFSQAYVNTEGQAIPLPFITGQQAQLQRSQALIAGPLQDAIGNYSDYRTAQGEGLKNLIDFTYGYQKDQKPEAVTLGAGQTYGTYDPKTGAFSSKYTAPANSSTSAAGFTLSPGDIRYDANGNVVASGGPSATSAKEAAANAQKVQNAQSQATNAITAIDRALSQTNGLTTGFGSLLTAVPGTAAHDLGATISTIKSVVAFQALQAMREASPTGGALGAVSDNEGRLLQNSIAALDQSQSKAQLTANLQAVRQHFANYMNIIQQGAAQSSGSAGGSSGGWDALN